VVQLAVALQLNDKASWPFGLEVDRGRGAAAVRGQGRRGAQHVSGAAERGGRAGRGRKGAHKSLP
jgi:hypothetical protein